MAAEVTEGPSGEAVITITPRECKLQFRAWDGRDHWHCDPCGVSIFDRDAASSTKCKRDGQPALNPDN